MFLEYIVFSRITHSRRFFFPNSETRLNAFYSTSNLLLNLSLLLLLLLFLLFLLLLLLLLLNLSVKLGETSEINQIS